MTPVHLFETLLLLMLMALGLAVVARRVGLPPAAAFVIGGIVLAFVPGTPQLELDPDLILILFLPPLLLSSAYFTVWRDFKANMRPILMLAIGAVLFTTFAVGLAAKLMLPTLLWAACFALGAIVSPPDAVSAKAILQRFPVPPRIVAVLEGESLVNDASGLMLYRLAIAATLTGAFSWLDAIATFGKLAVGGIMVGLVIGYIVTAALAHMRETASVILLSFLVSWGAYIGAESLHVSGVLAVVTVGLMLGWRQHSFLSAHNRVQARAVWELVVFVMEALVFILIGLALKGIIGTLGGPGASPWSAIPFALAVTAATIISRFIWVFPATYLPRFLSPAIRARDPYPTIATPVIVSWAGMRGVVSLAAALALPKTFPERDLIIFATFIMIAVTVLLQGVTLGLLVNWLKPADAILHGKKTLDERAARTMVNDAALAALRGLAVGEARNERLQDLLSDYEERGQILRDADPSGDAVTASHETGRAAALAAVSAARSELLRMHNVGDIHDSTLHAIEAELDLEELRLRGASASH